MINLFNSQETLVDFIIILYVNASHKTSPGSNDRKDLVKNYNTFIKLKYFLEQT